jgi:nitrite reductase (NADH) small subunit
MMRSSTALAARMDTHWNHDHAVPPMVDLGPVGFIPLGEGRAFVVNEATIAVFRQRDGRLFATDNACPHRGGPLADGIAGGGQVICPFHAWKIDLETGHCAGENVTIQTYPVQVVDGHIMVEIGPVSIDLPEGLQVEH